jgi:hypothetical protein
MFSSTTIHRLQKIYLTNTIITGSLFAVKTAYVERENKDLYQKFILMSLGSTAIGLLHPITLPTFLFRIHDLKTNPQYTGENKFKFLSWDEVIKKL